MNKVFLLFGSSGNLGKTAVDYFFSQDYDEYFLFTRKHLDLKSSKNIQQIIVEDLSIEENVQKAFNNIKPDKNNIYFLFNTIGGYSGGNLISDINIEDWQNLVSKNLTTSLLIAKYFFRLVKSSHGGSICFTSAYSSIKPEKNFSIYGMSKIGLNYLVKSLSIEGKEYNLSANAVAPYIIDSVENRKWVKDFSQMATTEEICNTVQKTFSEWESFSGNIIVLPQIKREK